MQLSQQKIEELMNYKGKAYVKAYECPVGVKQLVLFSCDPREQFCLRPIITTKGNLLEYQWWFANLGPDYESLYSGTKPELGKPIKTDKVIRIHPDDVMLCNSSNFWIMRRFEKDLGNKNDHEN